MEKINLKGIFEFRPRYSETDQMGVVYYGNYATYFEVGRVELLRDLGMSYAEMEGLAQQEPSRADAWATALEARLIERWMGTTFVILLLAIILLDLLLG